MKSDLTWFEILVRMKLELHCINCDNFKFQVSVNQSRFKVSNVRSGRCNQLGSVSCVAALLFHKVSVGWLDTQTKSARLTQHSPLVLLVERLLPFNLIAGSFDAGREAAHALVTLPGAVATVCAGRG